MAANRLPTFSVADLRKALADQPAILALEQPLNGSPLLLMATWLGRGSNSLKGDCHGAILRADIRTSEQGLVRDTNEPRSIRHSSRCTECDVKRNPKRIPQARQEAHLT